MDENKSIQILDLEQKINDLTFDIGRSTLYKNLLEIDSAKALQVYVGPTRINRLLGEKHIQELTRLTILFLEDFLPILEKDKRDTELILNTLLNDNL